MKTYPLLLLFVALVSGATAQENPWVNRINFNTTQDCIDSVTCYTDVVVDVNLQAVPDSAFIKITIGSTPGAEDIYSKQYQNTPAMFSLPEVAQGADNVAIFRIGKYMVTDTFYVDTYIE